MQDAHRSKLVIFTNHKEFLFLCEGFFLELEIDFRAFYYTPWISLLRGPEVRKWNSVENGVRFNESFKGFFFFILLLFHATVHFHSDFIFCGKVFVFCCFQFLLFDAAKHYPLWNVFSTHRVWIFFIYLFFFVWKILSRRKMRTAWKCYHGTVENYSPLETIFPFSWENVA